ncbi:MAG: hypothetical protein JNL60_01500 [Bacteroidia bacterium]|nr:hypothetical protein [Bacteroidia bacterium]
MVNVYKTNITHKNQALAMLGSLHQQFPGRSFNFDLEDCDKILRVEGVNVNSEEIIKTLNLQGFCCDELQD